MFKIAATTLAALALTGTAALAQAQPEVQPDFPWTEQEFMEAKPDATPEQFAEIDADGDGAITEAEYDAAVAAGIVEDIRG
ncbi:MAG: EF-hand domain-containing protein [Alkalilacustris sp.]